MLLVDSGKGVEPWITDEIKGGRDEDELVPPGSQGERACSWDEG